MKTRNLNAAFIMVVLFIATSCESDKINDSPSQDDLLQKDGAVATEWFLLLSDITRTTPYIPPQTLRLNAYSGITLYESVVPGMPDYQSIYTALTGEDVVFDAQKEYFWPASANTALAEIITRMLNDYTQNPDLSAVQQLESSFNASFETMVTSETLQNSKDYGKYIAGLIYDYSKQDGTFNPDGSLAECPPYTPQSEPGKWEPTPPFFFPAAGACQASLRTFIPNIGASTLPPAPPEYSTDPESDFYKMNQEVIQMTSNTEDDETILLNAHSWQDIPGTNYNTPAHMFKLTAQLLQERNVSLQRSALLFAKEGMAISDAVSAAMYAKYEYALLRPVTYIRDVMEYPDWNSITHTPQHPSYPAIAPAAAGAAVAVLENFFGRSFAFVDQTQKDLYINWPYENFGLLLQDVGYSRTRTGMNYQIAVDAAITQGRAIGEKINALPFKIQ